MIWKIFKFIFQDMLRNRWMFLYLGFFLLLTFALLILSRDLTNVLITLTNVILILTPLVGTLFGIIYFYNSKDFLILLLAQPISRKNIIAGIYLGVAASFSLSLLIGISIPLIIFGILGSPDLMIYLIICLMGVMLSVIFSLIAFLIALRNDNKIKGFGTAIFIWLFFAVIYDGIFLLLLLIFKDYPLENLTIALSVLNPIDLARTLIIMKMDISTMMGYTGAVLQKFFGSTLGPFLISGVLLLWVAFPFWRMIRLTRKKDF